MDLLSPFVGRARELASLQALLTQVVAGQGQVAGIVGEPASAVAAPVRVCGLSATWEWNTLKGTALPMIRPPPTDRCAVCSDSSAEQTDADSPEAMAAKLCQSLREAGMTPDEDVPYLLTLLGLPESTSPLAGISPEVRKARTLAILRHLSLHNRQGQLRVIAVENVHWIDSTSEEYLTQLADRLAGAKLLLVTTYRPGYRPS